MPFEEWLAAATPGQIVEMLEIANEAILRDIGEVDGPEAAAQAMARFAEIYRNALTNARGLTSLH